MKGLLLKDLKLMKTQGRSVVIIIAIAVLMLLADNNAIFAIAYANMIFGMLGITTLSYDVFDNGYAFLFTLPITRKLYVLEKYVFSMLSVATGVILSFILMVMTNLIKEEHVLTTSEVSFVLGYAIGVIVFLTIMLPVNLKFGPEKGRIAMVVVVAVIMASAFVLKEIAGTMDLTKMYWQLSSFTPTLIMGILGAVAVIVLGISYLISCKIMMNKEL